MCVVVVGAIRRKEDGRTRLQKATKDNSLSSSSFLCCLFLMHKEEIFAERRQKIMKHENNKCKRKTC